MTEDARKRNKRQIAAAMLAVAVLCSLLLSFGFAAAESLHHCEEEDCPICMALHQCAELRRHAGGAAAALLSAVTLILLFLAGALLLRIFPKTTPVRLKVRMND